MSKQFENLFSMEITDLQISPFSNTEEIEAVRKNYQSHKLKKMSRRQSLTRTLSMVC